MPSGKSHQLPAAGVHAASRMPRQPDIQIQINCVDVLHVPYMV